MSRSMADALPSSQSTPVVEESEHLSTDVDTALALLRTAVQDCGWTFDALEAFMGKGYDKSLISRVLNGERPLTLKFLVALPNDIEALYEKRRAEQFGAVVVEPLSGIEAQRAFVAGFMGLLSSRLPERADRMAKAEPTERKKATA